MAWQVGDRVRLITSGIPMTVVGVTGDRIKCEWHDAKGKLNSHMFPADALTRFEGRRAISFAEIMRR